MPKKLFDPAAEKPFKLSRSGLELFHDCPRCFYLDKRLGVGRPRGFPFNINSAVDTLLKREFDEHRSLQTPHPLMTSAGIDAVPFAHPDLSKWRHNFSGVEHLHRATGMLLHGAVDDLWQTPAGDLIVVDYKATAKKDDVTTLDEAWHGGYKRQLEIYQWLLRANGFRVADRAWWVYANGNASADRFDATIRFRMTLIPYDGDDSWVEDHVRQAHACLSAPKPPPTANDCDWCRFVGEASNPCLADE
jgi:hypothetical protein